MVVPNLHCKVLVNKFLEDVNQLSTAALLEQFYKKPGLPSLADQNVLARTIQLGVKEGAFGLVETKASEIDVDSLKYKQDIVLAAIAFMEDYQIISAARSQEILAEREKAENGEALGSDFLPDDEGTTKPQPDPDDPSKHEIPVEKRYKKVKLHIANIAARKIADANRGIILPISSVQGDFKFTLEIDVTSEDGITQSTIDNKIKETIKQIGAQILDEELRE